MGGFLLPKKARKMAVAWLDVDEWGKSTFPLRIAAKKPCEAC